MLLSISRTPMQTRSSASEAPPLSTIRTVLLCIVVLGSAGTTAELLLIGHHESLTQRIPLILLASAVVVGGTTLALPRRAPVRVLQLLMVLMLGGGLLGVGLHYNGNEEFELEIYPTMAGMELVSEALTGATPVLAPGSMSLIGVVGLVFTYRHPSLRASPAGTHQEVQS
jgi:hypothetical protein